MKKIIVMSGGRPATAEELKCAVDGIPCAAVRCYSPHPLQLADGRRQVNRAARALGKLGKGVPKTLTPAERQRRRDWMTRYNSTRLERLTDALAKATAKATPAFVACFVGSLAVLVIGWLIRGTT